MVRAGKIKKSIDSPDTSFFRNFLLSIMKYFYVINSLLNPQNTFTQQCTANNVGLSICIHGQQKKTRLCFYPQGVYSLDRRWTDHYSNTKMNIIACNNNNPLTVLQQDKIKIWHQESSQLVHFALIFFLLSFNLSLLQEPKPHRHIQ